MTLSSTVVGLIAALDDDDDAAVAASDDCFSFSEPSQRVISRVELGARLQVRSLASPYKERRGCSPGGSAKRGLQPALACSAHRALSVQYEVATQAV